MFNISHSGMRLACAFATNKELGIDIEQNRRIPDVEQVAQRFFSEEEYSDLMSTAAGARKTAFLNCWVRKEAYIKATGLGLSLPLQHFRVAVASGRDELLLRSWEGDSRQWQMCEFDPGEGYAGALVCEGKDRPELVLIHTTMEEIYSPAV